MEQNNSSIKQRILQYIDSQNISKRQFYIKTGIANGVLDKKTGLAEDNILRLISTFPHINSIWLLTGKGTMLLIPPTDNTAIGIAPNQQLITDSANHNDAFWQTEAFRLSKENHALLEKISSLMAEITLLKQAIPAISHNERVEEALAFFETWKKKQKKDNLPIQPKIK